MELDRGDDRISSLSAAPIPEAGLSEVLSKWIGRGQLFEGLAASFDEADERSWTARDLRSRAQRLLFEQMLPDIASLPTRLATWLDALPATRLQKFVTADVPLAGTEWVTTRIKHGWPPKAFAARQSVRSTDMLLSTTLKWTLERLASVRFGASQSYAEVDFPVRAQLDAATRLTKLHPLSSADSIRPSRQDLRAIARAGRPWGNIAKLAEALLVLEEAPERLAYELLMPDEEIRWRLFHLGVLGVLLQALRSRKCSIVSLRPISAKSTGPAFRITEPTGKVWSLWFEAAGIWTATTTRAPYAEATSGLALKERALGADLLLLSGNGEALVLECKYSRSPEFVARAGYYQAVGYAAELASRMCSTVTALVVGPDGVVSRASSTELAVGRVGTCAPEHLASCVDEFFLRLKSSALEGKAFP